MKGYSFFNIGLLLLLVGCNKLIEIDPPKNQLSDAKVFNNETGINAAVLQAYSSLPGFIGNFVPSNGTYVDELLYNGVDPTDQEFNSSLLLPVNVRAFNIWQSLYATIYQCNISLEGIDKYAQNVSDSVKRQFKAELHFLRAYSYYQLQNIYGDVPLLITSSVLESAKAPRTSVSKIYELIVQDLEWSKQNAKNVTTVDTRTRINKWAATALLAKIMLEQKEYSKAISIATELINSGRFVLDSLQAVFKRKSRETIWQLWTQQGFSNLGAIFIPASGVPTYTVSSDLLNTMEPSDARKTEWMKLQTVGTDNYHHPFKYRLNTNAPVGGEEYTVVMRLAEIFLVRAEAKVMSDDIAGAVVDVNLIRQRAKLLPVDIGITKDSCLALIAKEQRIELFAEGGYRFQNLKRTNNIDFVMSKYKPTWKPFAKLYPIPQMERNVNTQLTQNPGY